MLSAYLQSRVARRLFGLILIAVLTPVLLLGYFSFVEVRSHLLSTSQQWLRDESKAGGMSLLGSLHHYAEVLSRQVAVGDELPWSNSHLENDFSSITRTDLDETTLTDEQRRHLMNGGAVLHSIGVGRFSLLMSPPGKPYLVEAELRTEVLFKDEALAVPYCVLSPALETHYCSSELRFPARGLSLDPSSNSGVLELRIENEPYLAAYWRGRLQGVFAHPGFTVVTLRSRSEVLATLNHFRNLFPAVVVLAMVLAAWLAMGQIRRQMQPLNRLTEGAHRLAEGDFEAVVELHKEDEFNDLAKTFNLMTRRLKQKFHLLGVLGELDRAILSASEMEYVVQTLLEHAPLSVPSDFIGVLQFDDSISERTGWLTFRTLGGASGPEKVDVTLDEPTLAILETDQPCLDLDPCGPGASCLQPLAERGMIQALVFPAISDGRVSSALVLGFRVRSEDRQETVQAGRNIADRLALAGSNIAWEEKLYHNAHYDALTELPNRVLLRDRVEQAITRAQREGSAAAVMLVDLDRFKEINDSLGHSFGDVLLANVAWRMVEQVRASDTVARWGGDEFIILMTDLNRDTGSAHAGVMAEKLIDALAQPIALEGHSIKIEASIGIALFPDNADSFEELLKGADAAMYEAKRRQGGGYRFYSEDINANAQERFRLSQELRRAFEQDEFLLYYQPKVDADNGQIVGAEALVRWQSPERGLVSPGQFIPVVDEIGLSARLGKWVLRTACAQLAEWDRAGLPPITVSVNISPSQFVEADFLDSVTDAVSAAGIEHHRLELEILEVTAIDSSEQTQAKLLQLRDQNIHIALDDFGTGYSSLVYLTRIPASVLKLDREFIRSLATDQKQASIVAGIVSLAKHLEMQTVAEGVEEKAQWEMLSAMGCDLIQGFYFSPPLPAQVFHKLFHHGVASLA